MAFFISFYRIIRKFLPYPLPVTQMIYTPRAMPVVENGLPGLPRRKGFLHPTDHRSIGSQQFDIQCDGSCGGNQQYRVIISRLVV